MSERTTPETDALILSKEGFGATNYEWREHSRRLERERDEARGALSEIALYLSVGMGDETTTAQQYKQRILEGIKMLSEPIVNLWKQAEKERDEARETAEKWKKLHDAKDELFKKGIAEVERERDEARAQAIRWHARLQEEGLEEYGN